MKKKKILEGAIGDLKAVDGVATYKGVPLAVASGPCTSPSSSSGAI